MEKATCELRFPGCIENIEFDGTKESERQKSVLILLKGTEQVGSVVQMAICTTLTRCVACDRRFEPEGYVLS